MQLQLNRGEARHELARWLFFANRGEFRTGDYEEIMNKASCLSLLSNAVLVWNTIKIGNIVGQLPAAGEQIDDADLSRVSPLAHRHVIPNGTYFLNQAVGDPKKVLLSASASRWKWPNSSPTLGMARAFIPLGKNGRTVILPHPTQTRTGQSMLRTIR